MNIQFNIGDHVRYKLSGIDTYITEYSCDDEQPKYVFFNGMTLPINRQDELELVETSNENIEMTFFQNETGMNNIVISNADKHQLMKFQELFLKFKYKI